MCVCIYWSKLHSHETHSHRRYSNRFSTSGTNFCNIIKSNGARGRAFNFEEPDCHLRVCVWEKHSQTAHRSNDRMKMTTTKIIILLLRNLLAIHNVVDEINCWKTHRACCHRSPHVRTPHTVPRTAHENLCVGPSINFITSYFILVALSFMRFPPSAYLCYPIAVSCAFPCMVECLNATLTHTWALSTPELIKYV